MRNDRCVNDVIEELSEELVSIDLEEESLREEIKEKQREIKRKHIEIEKVQRRYKNKLTELRTIQQQGQHRVEDKYGAVIKVGDTVIITNYVTRHSVRKWANPKKVSKRRRSIRGYDVDKIAQVLSFESARHNERRTDRVNIETDAGFITWRLHYNLQKIDIN